MTTGADQAVERGSARLHRLAQQAADRGGVAGKLAQPLEEDAQFLRKLKPSLIAKRIRGEAPTGIRPAPVEAPASRHRPGDDGPNPLVLIGAAALVGLTLAKLIDWRGHAYARV